MTSILTALHIISKEAKQYNPHRRYIAKPFTPNGQAKKWGVYDQKEGKYLREDEIEALSLPEIREQFGN